MKPIIFLLILALAGTMLLAAPHRYLPLNFSQPDGSPVSIYASGDEFHNWLHDADFYTIVRDDTDRYVYARQDGDKVAPTELVVGINSPQELGLQPGINLSPELIAAKYARYESTMRDYRNARSPHQGQFNNLVIFIKFADDPDFSSPLSMYDTMFNDATVNANSMVNFFNAASYNQLNISTTFYPAPNGDIVVSYTDINPRNYYRIYSATNTIGYDANNDQERTNREMQMLARAVAAVGPAVPADLVIDGDDDGYVDNTCFIIQGSPDGWAELLWPHRWVLYGATALIHGKRVWDFNFQLEFSLYSDGASVLSHEMFHSLGAPDLYRYTNTNITPIGDWDLMSNNHNPPQHMSAWMKYRYGEWLPEPPVITQSGTYTLSPVASSSTNNILRVQSWVNNQYYVLEYRKPGGIYDDTLPGTGLLVYRLDTTEQGNAQGPPDELYIYRPGANDNNTPGALSSAYLSEQAGRTSITEATIPSGFMQNNQPGGLNLYEVSEAGETITFKLKVSEIQVTYPIGGEAWFAGTNKDITWRTKNSSGTVKIEYSTDLGNQWTLITASTGNNGTYRWMNIPAVNTDQALIRITHNTSSQWDSNTYPFSILTSLAIPVGSTPASGATNVPTNPQIAWQPVPGATGYHFQLSTDDEFGSYAVNLIDHPDAYYFAANLSSFTTYYWHVASMGEVGVSPFCATMSFTTGEISELPGVPDLLLPQNNATGLELQPALSWQPAYLATSYRLQISRDQYFSDLFADVEELNSPSYTPAPLEANSTYYWRVASANVAGISYFSLARHFSTGSGSPAEDEELPAAINSLTQNHPNPFATGTSINFSLKRTDKPVHLEIYNARGQLVRRLYSGMPKSSKMQLDWDGKDEHGHSVSSGIYLYRLRGSEVNLTRKMLLIR